MCKQTNGPPPKATLNHILNYCEAFLSERERFTWRHNSVLIYVVETLLERLPPTMDLYADLPGHNINGGTLPPHIAVTHSWPDLVLINKTGRTVLLLELTVSFETNCETAHKRKQERYQALTSDIEDSCFNCNNIPFEIGSRGHITLPNMTTLTTKHALCNPKTRLKHFIQNISRTSLLCSYAIYLSMHESSWTSVESMGPRYWKPYVAKLYTLVMLCSIYQVSMNECERMTGRQVCVKTTRRNFQPSNYTFCPGCKCLHIICILFFTLEGLNKLSYLLKPYLSLL
jgi:hypothetical protein